MITQDRRSARDTRHHRLRRYVRGSAVRPRLAVFRSLNHIYAQLIDDEAGRDAGRGGQPQRGLPGASDLGRQRGGGQDRG